MAMKEMNGEHPTLIVNISPTAVIIHRPQEIVSERKIRTFQGGPFQCVLAKDYLRRRLLHKRVTKQGNEDHAMQWDTFRWYLLDVDIVKDDFKPPKRPRKNAKKEEWTEWHKAMCDAPVDLDKLSEFFEPAHPERDWCHTYEPKGIATVYSRQAMGWLLNYPKHAKSMAGHYLKLLLNVDDDDKPLRRNDGQPLVEDPQAVQAYARKRMEWLEQQQNNDLGSKAARSPFLHQGSFYGPTGGVG